MRELFRDAVLGPSLVIVQNKPDESDLTDVGSSLPGRIFFLASERGQ